VLETYKEETTLKPLAVVALCPLSQEAQNIIVDLGDVSAVRALSSSSHLHPEVAARLQTSSDTSTKQYALRRSADVKHVENVLERLPNGILAPWAAANPLLSEKALERAARSRNMSVAMRASVNPSLKEEVARAVLTPSRAEKLVCVALTAAGDVIRGYELALAQPWMLEDPAKWHLAIRRGLTTLPEMTADHYEQIRKAGYARWDSFKAHQCRTGDLFSEMTTETLVSLGSCAADLVALSRDDFSADHVAAMAADGRREAEPHVVARVVDRFGPTILNSRTTRVRFSRTADLAAAWTSPAVEYSDMVSHDMWTEVSALPAKLGEDRTAWELFAALADDFVGDMADLVDATSAL
jgi:hypothetical protein